MLEYFLVIVCKPKADITWSPFRREPRGYQRVQQDRVSQQPSGQRNATKPEIQKSVNGVE